MGLPELVATSRRRTPYDDCVRCMMTANLDVKRAGGRHPIPRPVALHATTPSSKARCYTVPARRAAHAAAVPTEVLPSPPRRIRTRTSVIPGTPYRSTPRLIGSRCAYHPGFAVCRCPLFCAVMFFRSETSPTRRSSSRIALQTLPVVHTASLRDGTPQGSSGVSTCASSISTVWPYTMYSTLAPGREAPPREHRSRNLAASARAAPVASCRGARQWQTGAQWVSGRHRKSDEVRRGPIAEGGTA